MVADIMKLDSKDLETHLMLKHSLKEQKMLKQLVVRNIQLGI